MEITACDLSNFGNRMRLRHPSMIHRTECSNAVRTVLKSKRAIQVNIRIMRTFTRLRQMFASHEDLRQKVADMESEYDEQFRVVLEAIKQLLKEDEKPEQKTGFEFFPCSLQRCRLTNQNDYCHGVYPILYK